MQFLEMKQQPLLHPPPACWFPSGQLSCCESSKCPGSLRTGVSNRTGIYQLASRGQGGLMDGAPEDLDWLHSPGKQTPRIRVLLIANTLRKHLVPLLFAQMEKLRFRQEEVCPSSHRELGSRTLDSTPWTNYRAAGIISLPGTKP